MDAQDYIKTRLDAQIAWYSGRSSFNQRWFKRLRVVEILAASSIPLMAGFATQDRTWAMWAGGALGVIVAVASGVLALYRFQENWGQYRTTSESLLREKYLYLTRTSPYNGEAPDALLIQRAEALISSETSSWGERVAREEAGNAS